MKKLSLVLTLALILVGAFSAVALGAPGPAAPAITSPTVDKTHPSGYDGIGGTSATVNAHGGFTVNGDTCSVCHSMHYAGNSTNLTIATSAANDSLACLACHDGTTRNYNVISGKNGAGDNAMGGLFANYPTASVSGSGSMHDAFGTVEAYIAAPGGRGNTPDATYVNGTATSYEKGTWVVSDGSGNIPSSKLSCASCHDAHVAINPRLLSVNPNGIMDNAVITGEAAVIDYNSTTAATINVDTTTKYWFKKAPGSGIKVYVNGSPLTYIRDYIVNWQSFDSAKNTVNDAGAALSSTRAGRDSVFKMDHAYVTITKTGLNPGDAVTFDYKPAFQVQMKVTNYNSAGEFVQYGLGVENFCTACHTDFKGSRNDGPGYFGKLMHHTGNRTSNNNPLLGNSVPGSPTVDKQSIGSCLTCHFAHGTDKARWADISTKAGYKAADGSALFGVPELAGSSALKRLPNEAICVQCHSSVVANNGSGTTTN